MSPSNHKSLLNTEGMEIKALLLQAPVSTGYSYAGFLLKLISQGMWLSVYTCNGIHCEDAVVDIKQPLILNYYSRVDMLLQSEHVREVEAVLTRDRRYKWWVSQGSCCTRQRPIKAKGKKTMGGFYTGLLRLNTLIIFQSLTPADRRDDSKHFSDYAVLQKMITRVMLYIQNA